MAVTAGGLAKTLVEGDTQVDGEAKGFAALKTQAAFPSALTASPWTYAAGKLPGFGAAVDMPVHLLADPNFPADAGEGSSAKPYKITSAEELAKLAELVNAGAAHYADAGIHYLLTANLDLSTNYGEGDAFNGGKGWIPIGHTDAGALHFKGIFDGNGKTIEGLYINNTVYDNTGLFGAVYGGTAVVKNLGIVNANITGNDYVGGVAGYVEGGTVQNCYVTGEVSGKQQVGGVAGYAYYGTMQNCYATGAVSGEDNVGGVVGWIEPGTLQNCAALNPSVTATTTNAGRVAGHIGVDATLSGNIAFRGMAVTAGGSAKTTVSDATGVDGLEKNAAQINADGTLGGLFTAPPWTTENGKLPGFGAAVSMPSHLIILAGTVSISGDSVYGEKLTANTSALSTTSATTIGTLFYQWKRSTDNGATWTAIPGATKSTYILTGRDAGGKIMVTVTAEDCDGDVSSAATAAVEE
jgi:hypothetical protein